MTLMEKASDYNVRTFEREARELLNCIAECSDLESARRRLYVKVNEYQFEYIKSHGGEKSHEMTISRDCCRALRSMLIEKSDVKSGFSVIQALWDISKGNPRDDLGPGFFAEMIHIFNGVLWKIEKDLLEDHTIDPDLSGREAALVRSDALDRLWERVDGAMSRFVDGLSNESIARRNERKDRILSALGGTDKDWYDWKWHTRNVIKDPEVLAKVAVLRDTELEAARRAVKAHLPFGVTPYYASLMDDNPNGRDRAVRAQVLPTMDYVTEMSAHRSDRKEAFDFMLEADTSPIDLITRRYPAIVILKPFNTCPQICVYCQRNWEIDEAMAPAALAGEDKIEDAINWIEEHPSIREVLVTGGDPLALDDREVARIFNRLAKIRHLDFIRIGSRVPVTMPMRITDELAEILGSLREPGRRELGVVTHVEHPYEITPEMVKAIDRLRRQGLTVYNQLVYTFYVSRRFEATRLRLLLKRVGIDPYYTFAPKGKEETRNYRVPIARILQEQKEEARLLPGTRRTDEPVYNLPALGKNHVRAMQHRDLISVLPDGSRVYEFHPWEKNIVRSKTYVGADVSILEYLRRLEEIGENSDDYKSIWYYF